MGKEDYLSSGIPVSLGLKPALEAKNICTQIPRDKKRLLTIAFLAVIIGALISLVAKLLMALLYLITHLSFLGNIGFDHITPIGNPLGKAVQAVARVHLPEVCSL